MVSSLHPVSGCSACWEKPFNVFAFVYVARFAVYLRQPISCSMFTLLEHYNAASAECSDVFCSNIYIIGSIKYIKNIKNNT